MNPDPIAPAWVVFPIAAVVLIAVAGNIIALREAPKGQIPESRRRIRIATSVVVMCTIPLTAYGFAVASTAKPEVFVIVWTMVVGLLGGILILAGADMLNTVRLHRKDKARLRTDYRKILTEQAPEPDDE